MTLFFLLDETRQKKADAVLLPAPAPRSSSGFADIFETHLERHRMERDRVKNTGEDDETQRRPAFSMQKLYLSLLLRLGAAAPGVSASDPAAAALLLAALQKERAGARRLFSQDSDLFSIPSFPLTRFHGN